MGPATEEPRTASAWPHRLALATAVCAVPLVLFGGSVTTIGAGMAVDGWLVAEGHFMLLFPVDAWFRDVATFVEHTHRLFGALVGVLAIATVVATWRLDRRASARALVAAGLAAVCAQGALGGLRVLENDSQLAFLHGAAAQAVLALLCCAAVHLSPRWRAARPSPGSPGLSGERGAGAVRLLAAIATVAVYGQVVLGAWYRHSLRPAPRPESGALFLVHALGALLVLVLVVALAVAITRLARGRADEPRVEGLRRVPARLSALLGLQVVLGLLAWLGYRPDSVGPLEWGLAIAHVLGGGLLLAQCAAAWMWLGRVRIARDEPAPAHAASPAMRWGGAS